ncbi:unnamed protein product [Auanema sp. JU1783]|nr:unnamed protein product [Auanema sp. JU1783]
MDVIGLVSGGKDSCYNMMCAQEHGHRIVALANLLPPTPQTELDSFMYQSVGAEGVALYGEAMQLPLYRKVISGGSLNQNYDYEPTEGDEVEDLYSLLKEIKEKHPSVQGVSAGAILSTYQKLRVENVCQRLGLVPLCYLWEREQKELLHEMIEGKVEAIILKVAAVGLNSSHLGLSLAQIEPTLLKLNDKFGVHPCGEGGEYETFVLDCPLFKRKICIVEKEIIVHDDNDVAPVCFLHLQKLELVDK